MSSFSSFFQRTGGVNKASAGSQHFQTLAQYGPLACREIDEIAWLQPPFDFRIPGERAGAGAGDIGQDAVEGAVQRERIACIGDDDGNTESLQHLCAAEVQFAGDRVDVGLKGLCSLVTGRSAEIEETVARRQLQQAGRRIANRCPENDSPRSSRRPGESSPGFRWARRPAAGRRRRLE